MHTALTYVSGGCVFVGMLVELPGSHGVHLDEGDASTAPLPLSVANATHRFKSALPPSFTT